MAGNVLLDNPNSTSVAIVLLLLFNLPNLPTPFTRTINTGN